MRQLIFSTLLFTGCATADQVKELNTKVEEMEKKMQIGKGTQGCSHCKDCPSNPDETAAQELFKGCKKPW